MDRFFIVRGWLPLFILERVYLELLYLTDVFISLCLLLRHKV